MYLLYIMYIFTGKIAATHPIHYEPQFPSNRNLFNSNFISTKRHRQIQQDPPKASNRHNDDFSKIHRRPQDDTAAASARTINDVNKNSLR